MFSPLFSYLGPDTMLPLTSVAAGIVGAFMMFGRNLFRFFGGAFRRPEASKGDRPTHS